MLQESTIIPRNETIEHARVKASDNPRLSYLLYRQEGGDVVVYSSQYLPSGELVVTRVEEPVDSLIPNNEIHWLPNPWYEPRSRRF